MRILSVLILLLALTVGIWAQVGAAAPEPGEWIGYSGPESDFIGLPVVGPYWCGSYVCDIPMVSCAYQEEKYLQDMGYAHYGIDIVLREGVPVYAVHGGQVVFAGLYGTYGVLVIVENGKFQSWYAHNSAVAVQAGDIVGRGQVVAYAGSTGTSTGAHLHFGKLERVGNDSAWRDPLRGVPANAYRKDTCGS